MGQNPVPQKDSSFLKLGVLTGARSFIPFAAPSDIKTESSVASRNPTSSHAAERRAPIAWSVQSFTTILSLHTESYLHRGIQPSVIWNHMTALGCLLIQNNLVIKNVQIEKTSRTIKGRWCLNYPNPEFMFQEKRRWQWQWLTICCELQWFK